jgi:hypothetical protein
MASATPAPPTGIQPSPNSAMCWKRIGPAAPPTSTGTPLRPRTVWRGLGQAHDGLSCTCSPWNDATSSPHSDCMASTRSRTTARRVCLDPPWSSSSSMFQP